MKFYLHRTCTYQHFCSNFVKALSNKNIIRKVKTRAVTTRSSVYLKVGIKYIILFVSSGRNMEIEGILGYYIDLITMYGCAFLELDSLLFEWCYAF